MTAPKTQGASWDFVQSVGTTLTLASPVSQLKVCLRPTLHFAAVLVHPRQNPGPHSTYCPELHRVGTWSHFFLELQPKRNHALWNSRPRMQFAFK